MEGRFLTLHKHKYHYKLGETLKRCKVDGVLAFCRTTLTASLFIILSLVALMAIPRHAHAATKTWDGECGVDITWSCANNWSDNTVPLSGDTVIFDNTSDNNSTVDSATFAGVITTININSGYDGTITLARSLQVTTTFSQAAGSFTASNQTLDLDGQFTLSAGNFTASSGTTTHAGAMTISGSPTFSANGGNWTFDGNTTRTLSCNNVSFNTVTLSFTGATHTISSNCSFPLGADPTTTAGAITLSGTLSGSGTLTTVSTFTLNSTYALTGFSGLNATALTIATGTTANFGSYTTFDINGTFTTSGTANFTAPSGTATFASTFTTSATGTFNANGGTVAFDGTNSATITCNGMTFNLVTFTHTTAVTKTLASSCTLPLGNNPTIGGDNQADVSNGGTLTGTGTLTIGTASTGNLFTLSGTSSLSGFSGLNAGVLTVSATNTHNYGSYSTFVVNGAFSQSGSGTFTIPSGADFNSTFALATSSGAVFNAPSGNATFASTFTLNTGTTFNANGGTITFDGGSGSSAACNNTVFATVAISHTAGTKIFGADCSLPLGNNPTIGSGSSADITINGAISGTGTLTVGTASSGNALNLASASPISGFSGLSAGTLTITGATINFGSYTTFVVNGAYAQSAGGTVTVPNNADFNSTFALSASPATTFNAPSGTMHTASNFTIGSGNTFNHNNGTIDFDGASGTLSCDNHTFNLVTFNHTGGSKTVSSNCSFPLGADPTVGIGTSTGGDISLSGTLSGTGTLTFGPSGSQADDFTVNSGGVVSGFSGLVMNGSLTVSGGTLNLGSYSPVDLNRNFILSSAGIFTAPSGTMTIDNTFTINAGTTFNANGGTVTFDGSGSTITCNSAVFNHVVFAHTSGTKTVSSGCDLPLGNNPAAGSGGGINLTGTLSGSGTITTTGTFTLNNGYALSGFSGLNATSLYVSGTTANFGSYNTLDIDNDFWLNTNATFTATSATMTVAGDFEVQSGSTFNANNGTVILDGSDQIINGTTFNNLTKVVASADTLTMPAGSTETILGTLTLKGGSASAILTIVSSTPGTYWILDPRNTVSVEYLHVTDSQNIGSTITACNSTDGGHNSGWVFTSTCGGSGGGSSSTASTSSRASSSSGSSESQPESTPSPFLETAEETTKQTAAIPSLKKITEQKGRSWLWLVFVGGLGAFGLILLLIKRRKKDEVSPTSQVIPPSRME